MKSSEKMIASKVFVPLVVLLLLACGVPAMAQNPFVLNQFTADPSARVFGDRVYVYPSHDILATKDRGRMGWFCMEDYHVFSSENLTDWTDHGMIVTQNTVPWVKPESYSMWAPDCIYRNGKYYFYFPSIPADTTLAKKFTIGVAIADKPTGPFVPQSKPIKHVQGIDPNVFIDKDGQAYLYWSEGEIFGAKLHDNMLELASDVKTLGVLPTKGLKEGPYMFERKGIYYLTYPHVENKIERLEYAISDHPLGPFKITGVIMDESPTGCWTNHQSIIEFKKQWYLFYHHNDLSPGFDKARSIRVDSLRFNADGTIQKVKPTLRGVGITDAAKQIQIDRYSAISTDGALITFLDSLDTFKGWKTVLKKPSAWVRYDRVDFANKKWKGVKIKALSAEGGTVEIRLNNPQGPIVATVNIPKTNVWNIHQVKLAAFKPGTHNLVLTNSKGTSVEIDWISFE